MLPKIKLTNLLIEVASWTKFDDQFTHASTGKSPKDDEKDIIMATLIAMGTNIGISKMADSTDGITYYQMANTELAHSIREGKVSASLIMGKIGSYSRQNSLALALKEMGRIEKTIFILDYISNEELRRRIQKGLNKGEAANALARAIFFAKRGEFHERDLQDQMQRASVLNILMNAITVWNTVYLSKAIEYLRERNEINEDLLSHVSPLNWEHINLYGHYSFDKRNITTLDSLRPLNIKSE